MAKDSVSYKAGAFSFWYIDSEATMHMSNNGSNFSSFTHISPVKVDLSNGSIVTVIRKGYCQMHLTFNSWIISFSFENVLYIPKLEFQLISVSVADKL